MFRVGQKVVCVDVSYFGPNTSLLRKGDVYTIASVDAYEDAHGEYGVTLVEIIPQPAPGWRDGFRASRFRPVVERKTDISIFTAMLNPTKEPAI